VSDEVKLASSDDRKGCFISSTGDIGHVLLPAMNYLDFSQFSFSLLQGTGNVSLSLKYVTISGVIFKRVLAPDPPPPAWR